MRLDRVLEKLLLEGLIGEIGFGKDEQAGGIAIEAVDQADAGGWIEKLAYWRRIASAVGAQTRAERCW